MVKVRFWLVVGLLALALVPGAVARQSTTQQARPAQSAPGEPQQPPTPSPSNPQAQPQVPTFRTGVRLVRVDVTAVGKGDEPVADLQASDFEVTEDGVPQKVDQMQFVRLDGHPAAGDDRSLEIRSQDQAEAEAARDDVRVMAIFLDDYHVDRLPSITLPLRRALSHFVDQLWPTDLVAIMDPLTPLSDLHFTRDRSALRTVIDAFEGRQGQIFPIRSPMEEAQLMREDVVRVRAEVTLSALAALVVRLGGLREGRKTVVFVSQGPPTMFGRMGASLQDRMREVTEAANRGNVTIYPLDPRGLGGPGWGARGTLLQLAAETGGRAITDTNDPAAGLDRILRDTSAYYVIGYVPTRAEDDGKYHKITVKVKRPGVRVLARQGYWAPAGRELAAAHEASARAADPVVARTRAAVASLDSGRRPADVWVGWLPASESQVRVIVAWEPTEGVTARPGTTAASLEVAVFDAENHAGLAPPQSLPRSGGQANAVGAFLLNPGTVTLRYTAHAEDGAVLDSWTQPLQVPDVASAAVTLSTPRFYRARSVMELRAIQAAADPPPTVTRRFARTDRVIVAAECRASRGAPAPQLEGHLLATDGRELAALALPSPNAAGAMRFELPLGSLGQGTYVLRLRAKSGVWVTEQQAAFSIVR